MSHQIAIKPLSAESFASFGDVIDASGEPTAMINNGKCARFNDIARLDFADTGKPGISVFYAQPYSLPHHLPMVERHPLGSQAFIPMSSAPFLVIVAADKNGTPDTPKAFLTGPQQGVNIHRGIWHGVLTPLNEPAAFAVVDWIGDQANLEEHYFNLPWQVVG